MRPTHLRLARAAVVAWLVACIDGPGGPGNYAPATLVVRVTLPAGTPTAWSPVGETLHVAVRRAGRVEPIVAAARVVADSLAVTLRVPLTSSVERFVASGEVRYGGLLLFLGFETVQLLAADNATISIAAEYVGPGARAASYALGARDSALAPGDTASLIPLVRDSAGLVIPNVPARYVAANPAVVSVDAGGILTGQAGQPDTASVTGYLPMGLSSSLVVRRGPPVIPSAVMRIWQGNSSSWSGANNWDPAGVPASGDTAVIQASGFDPLLDVNATVAALRVSSGNLTLNGHTLTVSGDFSTENGLGTLTMLQPADTLRVLGRVRFDGGITEDLMDRGVLFVAGDFEQSNDGGNDQSFEAGDAHRTILNGSAQQRFSLEDEAAFGHLEFANTAGVIGGNEGAAVIQGSMHLGAGVAFAGGDITLDVADSLVTAAGSSLFTARVRLWASMAVAGTFNPNQTEFAGEDQPIQPGLDYQSVTVSGTARLTGTTAIAQSLLVAGEAANLTMNGHRLSVAGPALIGRSRFDGELGALTMQSPADTLIVGGDLVWGDGNGDGRLTAGVIRARGGVLSVITDELGSFQPSGAHAVVLDGSVAQLVSLEGTAWFHDLVLANAAGEIELGSVTSVQGLLRAAGPQCISSSGGTRLVVHGMELVGTTMDRVALESYTGPLTRLDSITFQNQDPAGTQLSVGHGGAATPFTFTGLRFLTPPTTGAYLHARDDAPLDGNVLTINLVGSEPPNGAAKTVTENGAIVNWDGAPPAPFAWGQLAAGVSFTCGLSADSVAYCWGINTDGQLGDGTTTNRSEPTAVTGGLPFTNMSSGGHHACAVTAAGAVYCWGSNTYGQLGDNTTTDRLAPTPIASGLTFAQVSAGDQYTCALGTNNLAYCWGRNDFGQLGDLTTTDRTSPTPVDGSIAFSLLHAGTNHVCGISGGAAYCWGSNGNGQLGDGSTTNQSTPVLVGGATGGFTFTRISPTSEHTCGVVTGGQAYCWGWNNSGQLGDGTTATRTSPTAVTGGVLFSLVSTGGNGYTCGLSTAGAAYCWGLNHVGQLGDGTQTTRLSPVAVSGGLTFGTLSAGFGHVTGIAGAGAGYAWGGNTQGQLGDGTTTSRTTPVPITAP